MHELLTVSHSGKQHAYKHALSVFQNHRLRRFVTSTYYKPESFPDCLATFNSRIDRALRKRWQDGLPNSLVTRNLWFELKELFLRNVRKNMRAAELAVFERDAKFDRWVAKNYAAESEIFWGFQGSCLQSLAKARAAGRYSVCEFATAHVTAAVRLLRGEAEKNPEWEKTISNLNFPDWYRERLEQEPFEAHRCVAASGFTKSSLLEVGIPEQNIDLLPLGADLDLFEYQERNLTGRLNVLFVGGIGQRKGIKYLLQAMQKLNAANVELQLLGPLPADTSPLHEYSPFFNYLGRTDQAGVVKAMHNAHVLVLPSVFEGFGLVIVEAMATGMPVIASTHSCGPEVIREGTDGFVLEPDDVDGLVAKLDWCAQNREQLIEMGRAAHVRAFDYSWDAHRIRLGLLLDRMVSLAQP